MGNIKTREEVNQLIEDMKKRSKGNYITQGVAFSKDNPKQMEMLKQILMEYPSFSGYVKELIRKDLQEKQAKPIPVVKEKEEPKEFRLTEKDIHSLVSVVVGLLDKRE